MLVRKPKRSICVSSVTTGARAVEVLAVEDNGGTETASWQIVENVGKGPVYTKDVGVLQSGHPALVKTLLWIRLLTVWLSLSFALSM